MFEECTEALLLVLPKNKKNVQRCESLLMVKSSSSARFQLLLEGEIELQWDMTARDCFACDNKLSCCTLCGLEDSGGDGHTRSPPWDLAHVI